MNKQRWLDGLGIVVGLIPFVLGLITGLLITLVLWLVSAVLVGYRMGRRGFSPWAY